MKKKIICALLLSMSMMCMFGCGNKVDDSGSTTMIDSNPSTPTFSGDEVEEEPPTIDFDEEKDEEDDTVTKRTDIPSLDITEVSKYENNTYSHLENMIDYLYSEDNKNIVLSGTSLDMALGMAMIGSDKETLADFENYYGVDAITKATRDTELMKAYTNYEDVLICLSNAFYSDTNLPINEDFINLLTSEYYYADIKSLGFHSDSNGVANIINQFCNDNTNGMIKEIIDSGTVSSLDAVIINALYFNGKWEEPFTEDRINDLEFRNVDGTTTTVDGMEEWGLACYENDNAIAFSKYYEGYDFSFIGILPNEDICDENGNFNLADIDIKDLLNNRAYNTDAHIILPKFKVEDTNSLKTALENEGLTNMFEWGEASNFSKISDYDLVISDVLQKTVVDVDAEGTEASAVTVIEMKCDAVAMPEETIIKDVILDRPFVFMIYDNVNDEILFIGKMVNM